MVFSVFLPVDTVTTGASSSQKTTDAVNTSTALTNDNKSRHYDDSGSIAQFIPK